MSPGDRILYVYIQYIYYMYMLFNWAQLGELDLHPFHRLCPLVAVLGFKDFPLMLSLCVFFPTCRALLLLTSTASARSQWALPDLNCQVPRLQWALPDLNSKRQIARSQWALPDLATARPQDRKWPLPAPQQQVSTASAKIAVGTAGPQQPAPRSQCALPDLNSKRQIAVGTPRPQQQGPRSQWALPGPTSKRARARSQLALPDPTSKRQIAVATTGPQQQGPDRSGHYTGPHQQAQDRGAHYRTSTARARSQLALDPTSKRQIAVGTAGPEQQAPDRSGHYQTSTAS